MPPEPSATHLGQSDSGDLLEGQTCPECGAGDAYQEVGPFRVLCIVCGALLKRSEVING